MCFCSTRLFKQTRLCTSGQREMLFQVAFVVVAALSWLASGTGNKHRNAPSRSAGILYETWHTHAAEAMRQVLALNNKTGLTTETVLRAGGALSFNDVYGPFGLNADIYGVQPELGFYCLWSARPGDPAPSPSIPNCDNVTGTLTQHARWLTDAAFDYVTVDWTNWPQAGEPGGNTDVTILRPTEVMFDEWLALRAHGISTPSISVWPCSPAGSDTWQWALTHLYQNASRASLIWHDPEDGRPVMFIPYSSSCYDAGIVVQVSQRVIIYCTMYPAPLGTFPPE